VSRHQAKIILTQVQPAAKKPREPYKPWAPSTSDQAALEGSTIVPCQGLSARSLVHSIYPTMSQVVEVCSISVRPASSTPSSKHSSTPRSFALISSPTSITDWCVRRKIVHAASSMSSSPRRSPAQAPRSRRQASSRRCGVRAPSSPATASRMHMRRSSRFGTVCMPRRGDRRRARVTASCTTRLEECFSRTSDAPSAPP
jgi:hypothetical protein